MADQITPPPGYQLDNQSSAITPPPGYTLDGGHPKPSFSGFLDNVGDSASKFAKGIGGAVMHPLDTAKNLAQVGLGAGEAAVRPAFNAAQRALDMPVDQPTENEQKFHGVVDHYKDRYGSVDKALHTAYTDPVGSLADVASVAGGVGAAAKLGNIGRTAEVANAVSKADPINVVAKTAGLAKGPVSKMRDAVATRMYGSAIKAPPAMMSPAEHSAMVDAGLSRKIPLTHSGSAKVKAAIDDIDSQVENRVKQGAQQGDTIDSQSVADATDRTMNQKAGQINPVTDVRDVNAAKQEFLEQHGGVKPAVPPQSTGVLGPNGQPIMTAGTPAVPPQPIPVDKALDIARKTKPKAYGELSGATNESLKDMKRDIKQQIYAKYPELAGVGQKERNFINLDDAIDRFLNREGNKTVLSMAGPVTGLASEAIAPGSGFAVAAAKHIIDKMPGLSSRIAIALSTKAPTGMAGRAASATIGGASKVATPAERISNPASNVMQMPMPLPAAARDQNRQPVLGAGMMPPPSLDPYGIR